MNIDKLKSTIGKRGGIAKANRFKVMFTPPQQSLLNIDPGAIFTSVISGDGIDLKSLINDPRDISMLCESASIPGRQFSTDEVTMHKQTVKMPYGFIDEDISMTFLLTNDMYMKKMFDNWTQSIINDDTYTLGYKKDYTTDVIIQQLNADNKVVYGAKLENAFPITIAPIEYSNDADGISKLTVTFAYDKYKLEGAVESGLSGITSALEIIT
jgi:hypothetical protein